MHAPGADPFPASTTECNVYSLHFAMALGDPHLFVGCLEERLLTAALWLRAGLGAATPGRQRSRCWL